MICYVLAMGKQHLGPHVVVGYDIKTFWPGPFSLRQQITWQIKRFYLLSIWISQLLFSPLLPLSVVYFFMYIHLFIQQLNHIHILTNEIYKVMCSDVIVNYGQYEENNSVSWPASLEQLQRNLKYCSLKTFAPKTSHAQILLKL